MYIHAQRDVSDGLVVVIGSARACCTKGAWQDGRGGRGAFLYKHDGSSIENDDSSIENDDSSIENDDFYDRFRRAECLLQGCQRRCVYPA